MIRRARPEDAEAIGETFIASFETLLTFLPNLHTHDEQRHFINEIAPLDHEIWVAEDESRVVGLAAVGENTRGRIYLLPAFPIPRLRPPPPHHTHDPPPSPSPPSTFP